MLPLQKKGTGVLPQPVYEYYKLKPARGATNPVYRIIRCCPKKYLSDDCISVKDERDVEESRIKLNAAVHFVPHVGAGV
ncbi:hypothetical protein J6590_033094 [Homalodisca vitripennis]|nr:hypothetical protein J6590_033094 [Homalodisca vitripennis]